MLRTENLKKTYDLLRAEVLARIEFDEKLLTHVTDPAIVEILKRRQNEAIQDLLQSELLPVVRNVPREAGLVEKTLSEGRLLPPTAST